MHLPGTLCLFVTLFSLTQVEEASASCVITSITSPTASSLYVKWNSYQGATNYLLEFKAVNSPNTSTVSVPLTPSTVEKQVQGLKPGQIYQVTFKVFLLNIVTCLSSNTTQTVPAASQITDSRAISSTSIRFVWSMAQGADRYFLIVSGTFHSEIHNLTFTTLNGQVDNLRNNTPYNCYVYSSNAAGLGAKSSVKTIRTLVQPPGGISLTELSQSSVRVSWLSIPGVLLYQRSVRANNKPGFFLPLRNVTGTTVNITDLEPCLTYTIGIASVNMFLEPGEPANITYTTSTITTVSSISVEYSCVTAMASISWNAVFGATSYRATITDGQRRSLNCTSTSTACQIPMVQCGERYSVRITAIANCESTSDGSYVFETAPCPPKAPQLYRECSSNVILFSWSATNNTAYYHAQAVDSDGLVTDCITMDTSCYFTDSICGKGYSFYVKAIYSGSPDCNSGYTTGMVIKTGPCLPQNVITTASCNSISSAITSWDKSEGALTYTVEARGNRKDFYNCTSSNNSCTLTGLDCGESLSVWIFATDGNCTTDRVIGEVAETGPCIPQNVSAVGNCSSDSASLTWLSSNGAVLYIGKATGSDGTVRSCTSMMAECTFTNLTCGITYDAFVMATNLQCSSSESQHVTLKTAPCIPTHVTAALNCSSNTASITWNSALGATWYLVKVEGSQGYKTSCNNTITRCDIPNLQCGQEYSITVMGMNGDCIGPVSQPITLVSAPCPNTGIQARLDCRTNSALISWTPGNGTLNFNATLQSFQGGQKYSCFTSGSSCNISSLQCGTRYNVSVTGLGQNCSACSKSLVPLDTAPCVPTQFNVSLSCGSDTASVSWAASSGPVSYYIVTAESDNGITLTCNSSSTSCNISRLACGQAYNVSVTAVSANCPGQRSEVRRVNTAPCVPQNVSATVSCSSNITTVTWGSSQGAELYSVIASSVNGLSANCTSASTSCDLSTLTCGETYTITVKAKGSSCCSGNSSAIQLQTAPCLPLNIQSRMNCGNNTASVSWSRGSGALSFLTTLECSNGQTYMCRTNETGCDITNMTCGRTCLVKVVSEGRSCNSSAVTGSPVITAPCPNTGIQARLDCRTNSALISWTPGNGTLNFNATLQSFQDVQKYSCFTSGSSCNISSLQCGTRYNVSVTGHGQNCSTCSKSLVTLDTAPCVPTQFNVSLSCGSDTASVSWAASSGPVSYYIVTAESDNGITLTCNSSSTSCNISRLACGQGYNVSLTTMSADCTGQRSEVRRVSTAPCVPQNVSATVSCSSNITTVTWGSSQGAELYSVIASSVNGLSANCTSASTSCDLSTLTCGESYTITVKAKGSSCCSGNSSAIQLQTAPCLPLNIQSRMNCGNNTASVSWSRGNGALSFLTTLECSNGQTYMCRTNETGCDITNMTCGRTCLVKVVSEGRSCNSSAVTGSPVITAPCPNTGIQARLDCRTNSALISWTPGNGTLNFNATLQSFQDVQKYSCFTSGSSCNISSLQCGTRYNVSVTGHGQNCSTCSKSLVTLDTAPCVPTQFNVSLSCGSDTASVSWAASSSLVSYYIVTAESDNGITLTCNSSSTSCNISRLACGQGYNMSLTTMSADCTGQRSEVRRVNTAPCVPQNVSATVSCSSNITTVTWGRSQGAELYSVTASSVNGLSANCTSASTSCDLSTLTCGESYTITVKAKGSSCCSGNSSAIQVQTAPCLPLNVQSRMNCGNNTASVSWSRGSGALSFLTLECSNGQTYMCRTNETGCDITNMTCGQTCLVKVVSEGRSCNSSAVTGSPVITAPCPNTGIQARLDCRTNSALISWTPGNGTLNFNATLQSFQDVQKYSCFTSGSSCNISSLQCGTRYNVSVTGHGQNCSACSKSLVPLDTAPCVPTQFNVSLSCGSDTASVSWAASSGPVSYYIVTAESDNGIKLTCNSSSTSCNISPLACGQAYNVSVTAMSADCPGQRSEVRRVNTAPCVPQNVSATVSCSSNIATVTWGKSQGAELYSVIASSVNGLSANCTSASTSCDLSTLTCGESYTITVKAKSSSCCSGNSSTIQVQTAPCLPLNVQSRMNCGNNTASVSWSRGSGALSFLTLECSNGQTYMCRTNETGCDITNLTCGQTCLVKVVSEGRSCNSSAVTGSPIITAPCPNTGIQARLDCRTNSALISWTPGNGTLNFNATLQSFQDVQKYSCFTSGSSCNISSLQCGTRYNVSVTGHGQNCSTCSKSLVTLDTAPCVPTQFNVSLCCGSDTASVSWAASSGLVSYYLVTAESDNGITLTCNSSSTSCNISRLACGQAYNMSLTTISVDCTGQRSEVRRVNTAPCVPQNVSATVSCSSNITTVTWGRSQGAELYSVIASSVNGLSANCTSASTSCDLSTLTCGESYTITVKAKGSSCCSGNSSTVQVQTAPCLPLNVQSRMNCGNNTASVSWSRGSGALSFLTLECSNGQTYMCRTNETGCDITNMTCGQTCLVKVVSEGRSCNSSAVTGSPVITAPCPNTGIQARLDCRTNSALISWTPGNGTLNFNATLQSFQDVQKYSCFTSGSSCNISSLQCGTRYNVSVTGHGQNCSTCSKSLVTLDTAPCVPTQVNVSLSCGSDTASVSWAASSGPVSYYIVTAESDNGITLTCNSSSTSCNISRLACGQAYNVSVTAVSANCPGQRSEVRRVNTAPCVPQNVSATVSCSSNITTVTWGSSQGAELYSVIASSVNGLSANCTSASTSCDLSTLTCGETYTITVKAKGSSCCSGNSSAIQLQTAPCLPLNIQSRMNCGNNTASVSWSRGSGALSFLTTLECSNGQTYMCRTNETGCDITNMTCGRTCLVKVVSEGRSCNSSAVTGSPVITAPCPNTGIQARLDCRTNSALISWTPGNGTLNFNATLQSFQDVQKYSCFTSGSSCNISSLQCGTRYNVSVTGHGQNCSTCSKSLVTLDTAPCVPTQFNVSLSCGSDTASVSWAASSSPVSYYLVTAESDNGITLTCNSSSTSCNISRLACGQGYNVSLTTVSADCTGQRSEVRRVNTAPCVPQNVSATVSCSSNITTVTWGKSQGAELYSVTASSVNGLSANCTSASTSCDLSTLTCGESYTITVKAKGSSCCSGNSSAIQLQTAPCLPLNIQSRMNCGNNTASVSWSRGSGALSFLTTLECSNGQTYMCRTNETGCDITNMTCGRTCLVKVVSEGRSCNSSAVTGSPVITAPCPNTGIQGRLDCRTNSALISWTPGNGTLNFNATLQSFQDIQKYSCFTSGSSCNISSLQCGTRYNVSVTGHGQNCSTCSKSLVTLDTAPCVPTQFNVSLSCGSDTASVSWAASSSLVSYYLVTAESDNGITLTCNSSSTSCNISRLACGQGYNMSLTTMSADCTGQRSEVRRVNTAPCVPQNVSATVSCSSNITTVTWGSSQGAELYSVIASSVNGLSANCTSASTSCDLSTLTCGETYTITVKAKGSSCCSGNSSAIQLQTAPCPPLNIQSRMNCGNNTASVSWSRGNGALSFLTTLECSNGQTYMCRTNETGCDITNLTCGRTCLVKVVSEGRSCNSSAVTGSPVITAPCPNTGIQARLDCRTNSALISWTPGNGTLNFNATLQSFQDVQKYSCFTSGSSCNISSLQCGTRYNVSVTGHGQNCSTCSKSLVTLDTAPCVPTQFNVSLSCGSDTASVSWAASSGPVSYYIVTAESDNGITLTCNSSSTSCNISRLACGQGYNVSLTTMSADCTGQRSEMRRVNTAPCVPQNVSATVSCSSNITTVTWGSSQGAELYSVIASSVNGLSANCTSASTSCDLSTLTCGESYTITVKAKGSSCCSGNSSAIQLQTAPCLPLNIQSRMNCGNNTASVSWSRGSGALSFLTTLECSNGQTYMCRTNETGCDITNMTCGRTCLVKVVSEGRSCNSSAVTGSPVITAPCPNTGIQARLDCRTNSALISWTPGNGTLNFNATLQSFQDIQKYSCFTSGSSCNISSLQCGTRYNVSVTGHGQNCSTCSKSLVTLDTAPCVPTQVNVSLCCGSDTASVSWAASSSLVSYYLVTAESDNGITLTCNSSSTSCNITRLACGQAYNVSVTAMMVNCTGQRSEVRRVNTAPCPPQNVSANVQCNSGSVLVSWTPVGYASQFRVEMVSQSTGVLSCNSSNTQCSIALLPCGESFNVSVVALRGSCQSQPSSRFNIFSAPCTPQRANGTVDCVTNSAWVTWDVVKSAESYTVLAVGDDGLNTTCSSPNNTCNVPDLGCGKSYTFQVTASTTACVSPPSNSFQLETAPCALSTIVVVAECRSSVIMVQWQRATRVNSRYIVTAEDQDRVSISCNSSTSSCNLTNVLCGKEYTIIVSASSNQCSSLRSPPYKIRTAPCQPSQVQTYTDCQSKAVFVSWEPSYVAQSYLLTAVGRDGDLKTCNTSYSNCTLTDLRCSNTYSVSILASNENCTSLPNTNVTFKTVPCEPANVTANILCNRTASLSWVRSTGAVAYVGIAQSENGTKIYCQNTDTSCTLAGLVCGAVYNFTVQATDGICNSSLSKPKTVGAAPCPPAGLKVVPLCRTVANGTQILRASWSNVSCPNSEYLFGLKGSIQGNSQALFDLASYWTSRLFFEMPLPCGSSYTATIRARNNAASSVESAAVNGTTVPCPPVNVTFSASSALVTWSQSIFATNYTTYGVTSSGRTKLCMTTQLQCSIGNFSNGTIVVTARNTAGQSEDSAPVLVPAALPVRRRR